MLTQVRLPGPLRRYASGEHSIAVDAETVGGALDELLKKCEGIRGPLYDEKGEIRKAFNIFLNDESITSLGGLTTIIKEGDEVSILVALCGG